MIHSNLRIILCSKPCSNLFRKILNPTMCRLFVTITWMITLVVSLWMSAANDSSALSSGGKFEEMYQITVKSLNIENISKSNISGKAVIYNPFDSYFSEIFVGTELYLKTSEKTSNLINKSFTNITLAGNESLEFKFQHEIPYLVPKGTYDFMIRLFSRTGIPLNLYSVHIKEFGEPSLAYLIGDPDKCYIEKDGKQLQELSGPNYKAGETPIVVLTLRNNSDKPISCVPNMKVFERSVVTRDNPIKMENAPEIAFNPGEEKEVRIRLPSMTRPESYLAQIKMILYF